MSPGVSTEPSYESANEDEGSVLGLLTVLLKRWRAVIGLPLMAASLTAVVSLIVPPTFTATTTFAPDTKSRVPGGLAGLAGQFGVSLGSEASESPRFYAAVVKSRELLERVLLSHYRNHRENDTVSDSTTLLAILEVDGRDAADSLERGVSKLSRLISVKVDNLTNIVRLDVDASYPDLAAAVANRLVEYLNDFNTKTRQSQARERRKFVEQRIADGERELRNAESDLRAFYERNRSWQQSPQLVFEEGRLRRQVEMRNEVYLTLSREYETARIQEVNDTPVITVIDPAIAPQHKSKPKRKRLVLLALLLGGVAGWFTAFGREYAERVRREEREEYGEFRAMLRQVRTDVARALRTLARKRGD